MGNRREAHTAAVRQITRTLYAQTRYNLLAEESEGFAKLVEALAAAAQASVAAGEFSSSAAARAHLSSSSSESAAAGPGVSDFSDPVLRQRIQRLTGAFRLDPTRSCDLLLDGLAAACGASLASGVLPTALPERWRAAASLFRADHMAALAGPKLRRAIAAAVAAQGSAASARASAARTSLCAALALLMLGGVMPVPVLLPHLPTGRLGKEEAEAEGLWAGATHAACVAAVERGIAACTIIVLTDGARDDDTDAATDLGVDGPLAAARGGGYDSTEGSVAGTLLGHPAADAVAAHAARAGPEAVACALLHMAAAAMERTGAADPDAGAAAWSIACRLLDAAAASGSPEAAWQPPVCAALCRVAKAALPAKAVATASPPAGWSMDAAAAGPSGSAAPESLQDGTPRVAVWAGEAPEAVLPVLRQLGVHAGNDTVLVTLVCRAAASILKLAHDRCGEEDAEGSDEGGREWLRRRAEALLMFGAIPALSVVAGCTPASMEAWSAMEQLPWHRRFRLFTWWHDGVYGLGPVSPTPRAELAAASAGAEGAAAAAGSSLAAIGAALPGEAMARLAAGRSSRMARHVLKRVAKDTAASATKALGRLIAAAPLPALSAMVVQLERFSNLVELSMDALRFATPLAVSALVFLLVGRMAADVPGEGTVAEFDDVLAKRASATLPALGREVYKEGEVMTAGWLANLASTAAWAVRRLPGADPSPLLVLVCRRLAAGAMGHLPLLHQLLELAGGIGSPGNATDDQTAAVGASTALQEALGYASVSTAKDGVVRLRKAIKQGWGAGPAALPLWVAVAQATEAAAFCEAARSANMIKAAAQLHDSAADALTQVTDLIHGGGHAAGVQRALDADLAALQEARARPGGASGNRVVVPASVRDGAAVACLIPPERAATLPSLSDLVGRFGLSPAAAFRLLRPWIRGASMPKLPTGGGGASVAIPAANGSSSSSSDAATGDALVVGVDGHTVRPSRWAATGTELELEVASLAAVPAGVFPSSGASAREQPTSAAGAASSSGAAAPAAANGKDAEDDDESADTGPGQLSPLLYSLFWSLDLFDLHCPRELYAKGEAAVKEAATEAQLKSEEEATPGETARAKAERERKLAAARKQAAATVRQLRRDLPEHSEHVARVRATFSTLAPWFGAAVVPASAAIANEEDPETAPHLEWAMAEPALARHCLLPRAAISPADALYAARFLRLIHEIEVPRMSTMRCLNASLFGAARRLLSSTEAEAGHLGIFLSEVMGWVSGWRDDREAFNSDAACRRGMLKAYMRPTKPKPDDASAETVKTSFVLFGKLCGRWDETITDTLCDLLASEEPMRRKAALLLTKRLSGVSPRAPEDLAMLHEAISALASSEQPKDIQVLALSTATDVLHRLKALGCAADGTPVEGGVSVTNAGAAIYAEAGSAAGAPDSRAAARAAARPPPPGTSAPV